MKTFKLIGSYVRKLTSLFGIISYVGFAGIMLVTVADVFMRYVFNSPITGGYEISQYLLMLATFASFAYCESQHGHINITMLIRKFPAKISYLSYGVTGLISTAILVLLGYSAIEQAQLFAKLNYITPILHVKTAPFLLFEAITMFLFAMMVFFHAIESFCAMFDKQTAEEVSANWS